MALLKIVLFVILVLDSSLRESERFHGASGVNNIHQFTLDNEQMSILPSALFDLELLNSSNSVILRVVNKVQAARNVMRRGKSTVLQVDFSSQALSHADGQQRPLLIYLQAILPSLNPTERQIADYVLEDPERVLSS